MSWRETKEQAAAVLCGYRSVPPERLSAARERSHGSDIWNSRARPPKCQLNLHQKQRAK
jgi:hypothetical protein